MVSWQIVILICDIFQQTYSKPYDMGQPMLNGGYYYSPSGRLCPHHPFSLPSLQFPVSGTPYTYHNGLAMFTADTGK